MVGPGGLLDRRRILELFGQLDAVLADRGVTARLFVVGKAALVLAHGGEEATRDVDAMLYPEQQLKAAAAEVAQRKINNLAPDWLNDAAKMYLPMPDSTDPAPISVFEGRNLAVATASSEYLLAMKLRAGRRGRDERDVRLLCELCGIGTVEEAVTLYESHYPEELLKDSSLKMLEAVVGESSHGRSGP